MPLSEIEASVCRRIEGRAPDMEALLGRLVDINSFTANHDGVNAVGQVCERELESIGLRTAAFVTGRSGHHLVARGRGDEGHRLLLLGHLDTVFPPSPKDEKDVADATDATSALTEDSEHGDRLRGPGVTDMKGGLVVMFTALRALHEEGVLDDKRLTVLLTADEETGSPTAHDIVAAEAADHHLCLVFESGSPRDGGGSAFVTERKGAGRARIDLEGVESHAGVAKDAGLSAALEAAHRTIALENLNDATAGRTVNVGVVAAGTTANTVPGKASLEIDFRFVVPGDGELVANEITRVAETASVRRADGATCRTQVEFGPRCDPLVRTDAIERMAHRIVDYGVDLGIRLEEESRGGASDGNIAAAAGCPTVDGLGSVGGRYHSSDEWVSRQSLIDRARLLAVTALRFYAL